MNRAELIEHIAHQADISKSSAARTLDAMIDGITQSLKAGDAVTLKGLGTFMASERAARIGRNPRTGEAVSIKAGRVPKFRAGKTLKDALD
jgi:DNA-binding protein HU-beta